jgi:hypothetical protein
MPAPRTVNVVATIFVVFALSLSSSSPVFAGSHPECMTNSTAGPPPVFIDSTTCGLYYVLHNARYEVVSAIETEVKIVYGVWLPSGPVKAMVVLFAGGTGKTGLEGDATTHVMTDSGNNFLVRSAQLFAEAGYATVVISRPSTLDTDDMAIYGAYRLSASHAQDIAQVIDDVRTNVIGSSPRVFFAGTSAGAISAFAQNRLSSAITLSSPIVTSSSSPYLGQPGEQRLQPAFLKVPGQILMHGGDGCSYSAPATAQLFLQALQAAGKSVTGFTYGSTVGFDLTGQIVPPSTDPVDACDALTHHGFLGLETQAASRMTNRIDDIRDNFDMQFPGNHFPTLTKTTLTATVGVPLPIQLNTLAIDSDGDALTFRLPYLTTSRGATLSLSGSTVTFTSSLVSKDGFVYVAEDGKHGKVVGVVIVNVQ